jgi:uncharacterized protein (DUF4213/DUF364 family)
MSSKPTLIERSRRILKDLIKEKNLGEAEVSVTVKALTPEEAIGEPGRRDFPIILGKERVIEAEFLGSRAHAFTDSPVEFVGRLEEVTASPLETNRQRAVYIAVLNAVLKHLGTAEKTIHCRDDDPEECAADVATIIREKWGEVKVGLIGLNPAIAEGLTKTFGRENVSISDLNRDTVGVEKFGVRVLDGSVATDELVGGSDVVLITGTTLVNGTIDRIMESVEKHGRDYLIFGVTGSGVCELLKLNRICPRGRD